MGLQTVPQRRSGPCRCADGIDHVEALRKTQPSRVPVYVALQPLFVLEGGGQAARVEQESLPQQGVEDLWITF